MVLTKTKVMQDLSYRPNDNGSDSCRNNSSRCIIAATINSHNSNCHSKSSINTSNYNHSNSSHNGNASNKSTITAVVVIPITWGSRIPLLSKKLQ